MSTKNGKLRSIALLTPGITPYVTGGLQRHSFNLARYFARKGVRVDLYHTSFSEGQRIGELEGMSAEEKELVNSLPVRWHSGHAPGHYIRSLKLFSSSAYELYRTRPAVDFIMAKSLTGWSFVEEKRSGASLPPIAVNFHGYEIFQKRPTFRTKMEAWMLRPHFQRNAVAADFVVSYGGRVTDILRDAMKLPASKIVEIPGGTDPALLSGGIAPTKDRIRFVFLGRYERRKGIEELNAAISGNPNWSSRCEFVFIGNIPVQRILGLPHVSYLGEIRNPIEIQKQLESADVLLCPSHSEGMPNAIMEGMAAGLAVLATDVGAVRLLVSDSNGILLPHSSVDGVAEGIRQFLSMSTKEIDGMKSVSHERIRDFFWPAIADRTFENLTDLIDRSK